MNENRSFNYLTATLRAPHTGRARLAAALAGAVMGYGYVKLITTAPELRKMPLALPVVGTTIGLLAVIALILWRELAATRYMNRLLEDNEQLLERMAAASASPNADRPARDCPFYGCSGLAPRPGLLMATGGNQCGAITERHTPCVMEQGGQAVEWWHCPVLDDRRLTLPHPHREEQA